MAFGITDPNQLVALGQEGTGAAQIFDSSQPTEQLGSLFERLNKEKQQARLDKQKAEQAKLAKLDKIAPVYGGWDADVPWFKKNFDAWKEIAVVDPDSPQAMGAYNDLIAASVMQEDQKKQALDYKDYLVKNKEKLTPEQFDAGTQWLENYRAAGNPIERANIPPPEYYDVPPEAATEKEFGDEIRKLPKNIKVEKEVDGRKITTTQSGEGLVLERVDELYDDPKYKAYFESIGGVNNAYAQALEKSRKSAGYADTKLGKSGSIVFGGGGNVESDDWGINPLEGDIDSNIKSVLGENEPYTPTEFSEKLGTTVPRKPKYVKAASFYTKGQKDEDKAVPAIVVPDPDIKGAQMAITPSIITQNENGTFSIIGQAVYPNEEGVKKTMSITISAGKDAIIPKDKFEKAYLKGKSLEKYFSEIGEKPSKITAQELIQKYSQ